MEPVTPRGWQAFVNHLAEQARRDQRRQTQENIGQFLYGVFLCAACMAVVGGALQAIGWIK